LRNLQIVRGLKIQPKARAGIEVPREPQCRIWSNPAALVNDLGDSCYWYTEIERQTIHAQAQRFHEVRAQDLAGDGWEEEAFEVSSAMLLLFSVITPQYSV
jgi:hypothetical protein